MVQSNAHGNLTCADLRVPANTVREEKVVAVHPLELLGGACWNLGTTLILNQEEEEEEEEE